MASSCGRCRPAARCGSMFPGMSCAACASRVETKLESQVRASVNFATRVAYIDAVGMAADAGVVESRITTRHRTPDRLDKRTKDPDGAHARRLLRRLLVAAVLFVPLADLSTLFAIVPNARVPGWGYA